MHKSGPPMHSPQWGRGAVLAAAACFRVSTTVRWGGIAAALCVSSFTGIELCIFEFWLCFKLLTSFYGSAQGRSAGALAAAACFGVSAPVRLRAGVLRVRVGLGAKFQLAQITLIFRSSLGHSIGFMHFPDIFKFPKIRSFKSFDKS